ncbi:MAG: FAD:protein FMN transferase [Candidatus Omnitrophica bacterium]|nr:FAD:protein FMN transferase [Candidatus Omnitrophota bacterium]
MLKKAIILLLLFFASCSPSLNKDKFVVSGTYLEVQSLDKRAAKVVYQEFRRLDSIFNSYKESSESYKLNKSPNKAFKASSELVEVIKAAKKYYQLSQGTFDITKAKLYNFWKKWDKKSKRNKFPRVVKIEKLKSFGNINDLEIDQVNKTIKLKNKNTVLDLSGIAKGYMVDKAVEKLKESGIKDALINAGGEIYCLGKNQGKPWKIGIRRPFGRVVRTIQLTNKAVATSGNYQQSFHIINPQTGYPVENKPLGVTVIADECIKADILATVFFIKGKRFAKKIIRDDASITAYFVTETGIEKIN